MVASPRFPQFIAPDVPAELSSTLAAWSHDRGWRFLQAGDLRNADQEFGLALRSPDFYPSMAGRGYVELARDEPHAALGYFDQALAVRADYVSALVGRGETLLALHREADAIAAFERALTTPTRAERRPAPRRGPEVPVARARSGRRAAGGEGGAERRGGPALSRRDRRVPRQSVPLSGTGAGRGRARRDRRRARTPSARRRARSFGCRLARADGANLRGS